MTDLKEWLERVECVLQVLKDAGMDTIPMRFTRKELIQLKMMIETSMEKEKITIVRCKDCIHADISGYCPIFRDRPPEEFFCRSGRTGL